MKAELRALIINNISSVSSGSNKSLLAFLRKACKCGLKPMVINPEEAGIAKDIKRIGGKILVMRYRPYILPSINTKKDILMFLPRLIIWPIWSSIVKNKICKICKEFKPDIIHYNTSVNHNLGRKAAKKYGIPELIHIREYGRKDHGIIILGLNKKLRSKGVYSISITKDIAREKGLLDYECSRVIYNGIINRDDVRYTDNKEKYFLYAGRIEATKGVKDLIEAYVTYASKSKNPILLKLAGEYNAPHRLIVKEECEIEVKKYGLQEYVEWLGERDDIADLMYKAYATIIPSLNEGFGRVMPEAMANGSLVIGRNTGGTKEQFDNGLMHTGQEIGLRFETIDELAELLKDVEENTISYYKNMIERSQNTVADLYSESTYAEKILQFYNEIINMNKHG